MNEKQKAWLIKTEKEIRDRFPDDVLDDADGKGWEELIAYTVAIRDKANQNEIVTRWLMEIIVEYHNRWKILNQPQRKTDNGLIRELEKQKRIDWDGFWEEVKTK